MYLLTWLFHLCGLNKIFTDASHVLGNVLSTFPGTDVDIEAQRGSHLSRVTQLHVPELTVESKQSRFR